MRVLYFTSVPLVSADNGGSICCRNHVRRLAQDPDIDLFVLAAGPANLRAGTEAFGAMVGAPLRFEALSDAPFVERAAGLSPDALTNLEADFSSEKRAVGQHHVGAALRELVDERCIDALVIDYHPSALLIDLAQVNAATVVIGLNREGDFHADMVRRGFTPHSAMSGLLSVSRARAFERQVNATVDQLVVIGRPDAPAGEEATNLRAPAVCITPWLDPVETGWTHHASRRAFFVGDRNHWPNMLAIDWLVDRLAPALLAIGTDLRIAILGADAAELGRATPSNIDLLGRGNASAAAQLFRTADMMLCPIENDYGVKFKALDALAHRTPLLASRQTLLGLPHLPQAPAIDLDQPEEAAALLNRLTNDPAALADLQAVQQTLQSRFVAGQQGVWSRTIGAAIKARAARIEGRG